MEDWHPSTTQAARLARDTLYQQIRQFFHQRNFIEVDPPLLGRAGSTDIHLHSLQTTVEQQSFYLQTSPEFFMKRLLAAGSGPIYALTKSFRLGEQGRYHNLEFTILEWYQPGFDDQQLMEQVADLMSLLFNVAAIKTSYRDAFLKATGINPHTATLSELANFAKHQIDLVLTENEQTSNDFWLDLIFSHCVQPTLSEATLIFDYPASQAALAQLGNNSHGESIARRFELFYQGVELGNGYCELTDEKEQRRRFEQDNQHRQTMGLETVAIDEKLLAGLSSGLPPCAGIAIGVDRLLMIKMGATNIENVIDFPQYLL